MSSFYTWSGTYKGQILERGYKNNKSFIRVVDSFKPFLFVPTKVKSPYKSLYGDLVEKRFFKNVWDARSFIKKYKDVSGFDICGLTNFEYLYLNDVYPEINPDDNLISICSIDIEVDKVNGKFADIKVADGKVLCLTLTKFGYGKITLGLVDYPDKPNYYKCLDEVELLNKFVDWWKKYNPDVITGWNNRFYDIPYMVNRIKRILGEEKAKELSPFKILEEDTIEIRGRNQQTYIPMGVAVLDYMELYKKFRLIERESYALGFICQEELGVTKIDYSEYGSLHDLYNKNPQLFIDYNIRDNDLIEELEKKFQYIKLVFRIAYFARVNYTDALTSVKLWDVIIHNFLMKKNIIIPPNNNHSREQIEGAYVKDPKVGESKWVCSFDFTSLYPMLMIMYNVSPEKFVRKLPLSETVDDILTTGYSEETLNILKEENVCITANHCLFSRDGKGFLGEIIEELFESRKTNKNLMIEKKKEKEKTGRKDLDYEIQKYDSIQNALKILLNSLYGAIANPFCRYYSPDQAEAITITGQLAIQWVSNKINNYLNSIMKENLDWIVANDTDSAYITLEPLVNKVWKDKKDTRHIINLIRKACEEDFVGRINKFCQELSDYTNAYKNTLNMKLECICDKGIWLAKKKYALNVWHQEGVDYKEPKLKIMGIEVVRSSTPASCRKSLRECIRLIMNGTEEDIQKFNQEFKDKFMDFPFEDIAFPRTLNNLTQYHDPVKIFAKGTPIHVRGALLYNHLLIKNKLENDYELLYDGQKIKFCYLIEPNPYGSHVITTDGNDPPKELKLENYIDYEMQFQKAFMDPLKNMLDSIGWSIEKRANNLESFIS